MSTDVGDTLRRAAAPDDVGPDTDAILARAAALRRRRRLMAGVTVLVPLTILAMVALPGRIQVGLVDAPPGTVLELPAAEEVAVAFLDDGTPVFVSNLGGGEAAVVDARVPYEPLGEGIDLLVMWCTTSGRFQEPRFGSEFAPDGAHLNGPAPVGLTPYRVQALDRQRVRATDRSTPPGRPAPPQQRELEGAECGPSAQGGGRLHHAEHAGKAPSPRQAVEAGRDARVVVWATLEYVGGLPPRLCDHTGVEERNGAGLQCADGALVTSLPPLAGDDDPDRYQGYQGVLVLDVRDGEVVGVTLTASASDYGGWFQGEWILRGTLQSEEAPDGYSALGEHAEGAPDLNIQLDDGDFAGVWLSADTVVLGREQLAGRDDPQPVPAERLLAAARAGEPLRLEITVRRLDGAVIRITELSRQAP